MVLELTLLSMFGVLMVVSYFFPTENPHENFAKVSNMYFLLVRKTTTRCVPIRVQSIVIARIVGIRFRENLGLVERYCTKVLLN